MMRPIIAAVLLLALACLPARADDAGAALLMAAPGPAGGGGGGSVTVTHLAALGTNSTQSSYTFPGVSLGTEAANRQILVVYSIRDTGTSATGSAVTVAGNSSSLLISTNQTGGGNLTLTAGWIVSLASGTSGDVVIPFSETVLRCRADVYAIYGSTTTEVAADIVNGTAIPMSVNGVTGGALVSFIGVPMSTTVSWTGVTENSDSVAGTLTGSGASGAASAGSNSVTPTSAGSGNSAAVIISFQP